MLRPASPNFAPSRAPHGAEDNWEDQAKRRLGQVHRSTQLALDLMGDEELKEILGSLSCI